MRDPSLCDRPRGDHLPSVAETDVLGRAQVVAHEGIGPELHLCHRQITTYLTLPPPSRLVSVEVSAAP